MTKVPSKSIAVITYSDPTHQQWILVIGYLFCSIVFGFNSILCLAFSDPIVASAAAVIAFLLFCLSWKCLKVSRLKADGNGVTEWRQLRNRYWSWSQIDYFGVEVRALPFKLVKSKVLVLHDVDGRLWLLDYVTGRPGSGDNSWVNVAARELNDRLAATRRVP